MSDRPTYLERAFALAEAGTCQSLGALREHLKAEGYAEMGQLQGMSVRAQLGKLIAAARQRTVP